MPQIQRIAADQGLSIAPRVVHEAVATSVSDAAASGEGAAQLGQMIAAIGHAQTQIYTHVQQGVERDRRTSEGHLSIDKFRRDQEQKPYDVDSFMRPSDHPDQPTPYETAVTTGVDKIISDTLAKVKDPAVRAVVASDLNEHRETTILRARDFANVKVNDAATAQRSRALEIDLNRAVDSTNTIEYGDAVNAAADRIATARSSGVLSATQAEREWREWLARVDKGQVLRDIRLDPQTAVTKLIGHEYEHLDPEENERLIREAQGQVVFRDDQRRKDDAEARAAEDRTHKQLGQQLIEQTVAGQDVSALLTTANLGTEYQDTFTSVRGVQAAMSRGDLTPSNPAVLLSMRARMSGTNPPARGEIIAAGELGPRNGINGGDMVALLGAQADKAKEDPWTPEQRTALGNAEQVIRDRLKLKVFGVDKFTEADNERQTLATNDTLLSFFDAESAARRAGEPWSPVTILHKAKEMAEEARNSALFTEGVANSNGQTTIFGQYYFEDAQLEVARRVKQGSLDPGTARLLLRSAESMPHKPKGQAPGKRPATAADHAAQLVTPALPVAGF